MHCWWTWRFPRTPPRSDSFSHYAVTVRGNQLDEIYHSIRAAECAVIMPGKRCDADAPHGNKPSMSVTDIRLKRLQTPS